MEINPKYKKIIKLLDFSYGKYSKVDVFRDFILMFAISIQNTFYYIQEYEDLYFQVLKKFKKEEYYIFYQLVEELVRLFLNKYEIADILGEIYTQIGAYSKKINNFSHQIM